MKDLIEALEQCVEALRLTREYVGEEMLPALEGWSWYDATVNAQDVLERLGRDPPPWRMRDPLTPDIFS